jgi:hypothetical protein
MNYSQKYPAAEKPVLFNNANQPTSSYSTAINNSTSSSYYSPSVPTNSTSSMSSTQPIPPFQSQSSPSASIFSTQSTQSISTGNRSPLQHTTYLPGQSGLPGSTNSSTVPCTTAYNTVSCSYSAGMSVPSRGSSMQPSSAMSSSRQSMTAQVSESYNSPLSPLMPVKNNDPTNRQNKIYGHSSEYQSAINAPPSYETTVKNSRKASKKPRPSLSPLPLEDNEEFSQGSFMASLYSFNNQHAAQTSPSSGASVTSSKSSTVSSLSPGTETATLVSPTGSYYKSPPSVPSSSSSPVTGNSPQYSSPTLPSNDRQVSPSGGNIFNYDFMSNAVQTRTTENLPPANSNKLPNHQQPPVNRVATTMPKQQQQTTDSYPSQEAPRSGSRKPVSNQAAKSPNINLNQAAANTNAYPSNYTDQFMSAASNQQHQMAATAAMHPSMAQPNAAAAHAHLFAAGLNFPAQQAAFFNSVPHQHNFAGLNPFQLLGPSAYAPQPFC